MIKSLGYVVSTFVIPFIIFFIHGIIPIGSYSSWLNCFSQVMINILAIIEEPAFK